MSRSYMKHPYIGDKKNKYMKKLSNKKIRQIPFEDTFYSPGDYKKSNLVDSYEICDYKVSVSNFHKWNYVKSMSDKEKRKEYKKIISK